MRVRMTLLYAMFFGLLHQSENVTPVCKFFCLLHLHRCIMTHCAALFVALRDELWPFWTVNLATKYQQQRSILNKACGSMLDSEFCRVLWQFVRRILCIHNDANTFILNFFNNSAAHVELLVAIPSLPALCPLCLPLPFILSFWTFCCISQPSFFGNSGESMPWRLLCLFLFSSEWTKLTALAPL